MTVATPLFEHAPSGTPLPAVAMRDLTVADRDPEQLRYLGELGVVPSQTITVLEKLPFDGPIRVRVGADEHLFGRPLAARIYVAPRGNR